MEQTQVQVELKWSEWTPLPYESGHSLCTKGVMNPKLPRFSPCCQAKMFGSLVLPRTILGICGKCRQVVAEYDVKTNQMRVKVAE